MRSIPLTLAAAALLCTATPATRAAAWTQPGPAQRAPATSDDFLYAIRMVEAGGHYNCPTGPCGEQGPYQFRRSVWRQYTQASFSRARTFFADGVAAMHYRWLVGALQARGVRPTVWNVAAAWNGGVSAVASGHLRASTRQYASRVVNLVEEREAMRQAATPKYRIAYAGR